MRLTTVDYITIGPSPPEEECTQLGGDEDYPHKARLECQVFIDVIRRALGSEPAGARLRVKGFEHDFGRYYEVVCDFETDNEVAADTLTW